MRLYRRGKIWHGHYYDAGGKRFRVSTKCTDRRAAEAALRRLEREAQGAARVPGDSPPFCVDAALTLLLEKGDIKNHWTRRMFEGRGGHIARLLGYEDVNSLTQLQIKEYALEREKEGAARETVRKELVTIRRALSVAAEHGKYLGDSRALMPKWKVRYTPRKRWLSPVLYAEMLALPRRRSARDSVVDK